jgi:hypothetical protein
MAKRRRIGPAGDRGRGARPEARRGREAGGPDDPRWVLRERPKLTPALTCVLLTGDPPKARVAGWVALAQGGDDQTVIWTAWAHHWQALTAEAASFGFEPWAAKRRRPRGPAVERWRAAFVAQHRY